MNNLFQFIEGLNARKFKQDQHTIGMQLMVHAVDTKHKVSLLTARGAKDNHSNFIKEINSIVGRESGARDYFVNDDLYAKRLDWIGNNALKKLHIIIEHLLGIRFDGKAVFGVENRKSKVAFFYDDEEKNLKILKEPLWSMYIDKVKFYLEQFTDMDEPSEQKDILNRIESVKNKIKIIDINKINDSNVEKYKQQISSSAMDTIHFFDIDGTLTSLKLEIDIYKDGKRVFIMTQEELAEGKELSKTINELPKHKIKQREDLKSKLGISDLTDIIKKAMKGEDGYSMNLDEFRDKRKIDRQVSNEPFKRRDNINESVIMLDGKKVFSATEEEIELSKQPLKNIKGKIDIKKREIIKKAIKGWHGYSLQ